MRTAERSGYLASRCLDLLQVRIEQAGTRRGLGVRRLLQLEGRGHGVTRAVQSPRDRPAGELLDLGQAADLGPQGDVHGALLSWSGCGDATAWRNSSPSRISPWPGSRATALAGDGSDST